MAKVQSLERWMRDHFAVTMLIVVLIGLLVPLLILTVLGGRLGDIEKQLEYEPPPRYTPPDLDSHAAEGVSPDVLAVAHRVYVPVYSHVYYNGGRPFLVETTLSIRNTDVSQPIYVRSVKYYNTAGELSRTYVDQFVRLAPLETIEFLVEKRDTTGGSGANFVVEWMADDEGVDQPLIESVMVGIGGNQTICFSRSGHVLSRPEGAGN